MMNKEYDTIVKKIKDKCKFDFLEKSRNRTTGEIQRVLFQWSASLLDPLIKGV